MGWMRTPRPSICGPRRVRRTGRIETGQKTSFEEGPLKKTYILKHILPQEPKAAVELALAPSGASSSAPVMWTDMDAKGGPRMCRPDGTSALLLKGPDGFATTWVQKKGACINTTTQNHCYRYYHRNHANHNNRHPEPLSFKPFLDRIC